MASNQVFEQGNEASSASLSTAPTAKITETAEVHKASAKKRSASGDVQAPAPKKKTAEAKANIANASESSKSSTSEAGSSQSGEASSDDYDYTTFEDGTEDDDFKSLIKKVRRYYNLTRDGGWRNLPKTKSGKDEVLAEVATLVRNSLHLVICRHNPDDAAKFQDLNDIKQFEFVCKPSEDDCVMAKKCIAILRKKGRVIVGAPYGDISWILVICS